MKPESQKRKHRYSLNLNESEYKEFKAQAKKSGLSLQDFARSVLATDLPDDIRKLRTRTQRLEKENESLQTLIEGANLAFDKAQELMDGCAGIDKQIRELEGKLSKAPSKPKPRHKEPEPESKEPDRTRIRAMTYFLGHEPDQFEAAVLEFAMQRQEEERQRKKERDERLLRTVERAFEKREESFERLRREMEERKQRRWSWTG